ncbi:hypothetical protein ACFW87_02765, partial [Streptomyces sp. NPDC058731]
MTDEGVRGHARRGHRHRHGLRSLLVRRVGAAVGRAVGVGGGKGEDGARPGLLCGGAFLRGGEGAAPAARRLRCLRGFGPGRGQRRRQGVLSAVDGAPGPPAGRLGQALRRNGPAGGHPLRWYGPAQAAPGGRGARGVLGGRHHGTLGRGARLVLRGRGAAPPARATAGRLQG